MESLKEAWQQVDEMLKKHGQSEGAEKGGVEGVNAVYSAIYDEMGMDAQDVDNVIIEVYQDLRGGLILLLTLAKLARQSPAELLVGIGMNMGLCIGVVWARAQAEDMRRRVEGEEPNKP